MTFVQPPQGINKRGVDASRYRFYERLVLRKVRV